MKKIGKLNVKKTLTRSAVIAVTGAASQIVATLVEGEMDSTTSRPKNAEIVDYAMIAAGVLLPEMVKNEMAVNAGDALLAVGAYRMAVAYNLSDKIGVNGIGNEGSKTIQNTWIPRKTNFRPAQKNTVAGSGNSQTVL